MPSTAMCGPVQGFIAADISARQLEPEKEAAWEPATAVFGCDENLQSLRVIMAHACATQGQVYVRMQYL